MYVALIGHAAAGGPFHDGACNITVYIDDAGEPIIGYCHGELHTYAYAIPPGGAINCTGMY